MKTFLKFILIPLVILGVIAGLIFAYFKMSKERANEMEREKPVAAESRIAVGANGETILTLDEKAQNLIALKTEPLAPAKMNRELKAYGRVLDPAPLAALVAELSSATAALVPSQKEFDRLKLLSKDENVSDRALQSAEAAARRDQLLVESARDRLVLAWGEAIAERADLEIFVRGLASGENALARMDLPAGDFLKSPPISARLFRISDETNFVEAEFISSAPTVDAQTQGQGFLFLVKSRQAGFAPGAAIFGFIKIADETQNGVVIPQAAVVRFNGKEWIYLQTGGSEFIRREVFSEHSVPGGWFVTRGVKAGDRVVVSGAQLLLSEEQKSQIHMGD